MELLLFLVLLKMSTLRVLMKEEKPPRSADSLNGVEELDDRSPRILFVCGWVHPGPSGRVADKIALLNRTNDVVHDRTWIGKNGKIDNSTRFKYEAKPACWLPLSFLDAGSRRGIFDSLAFPILSNFERKSLGRNLDYVKHHDSVTDLNGKKNESNHNNKVTATVDFGFKLLRRACAVMAVMNQKNIQSGTQTVMIKFLTSCFKCMK